MHSIIREKLYLVNKPEGVAPQLSDKVEDDFLRKLEQIPHSLLRVRRQAFDSIQAVNDAGPVNNSV